MKNKQDLLIERIESLCEAEGMTHYRLALNSAIPISTLDNILKKRTDNPGLFTIGKICNGLGMTLMDFFDCDEFREIESETK